ncbi:MAG TPA: polyketide synthase dehydratase domain-containing protein [bacterium]
MTIPVEPAWADHRFQGRAVLPAVEAMQLLAGWVREREPGRPVRRLRNATFDKFLELPSGGGPIAAWCELRPLDDGSLRAALLTRTAAGSSGMTRTRVHAQVEFVAEERPEIPAALDLAAALAGRCLTVEPEAIYRDLVPFGPAFRTIARPLFVSPEGALAVIDAPARSQDAPEPPLGSPFVLDAALHAACVWSQRHAGIVAFPVGFRRREIVRPTEGGTYVSRIFPVGAAAGVLTFDIWILDMAGQPCEVLHGVTMRDVSGGTLQPPAWVRAGAEEDPLGPIARGCAAVVLIEQATLMPFAEQCLTETERLRTAGMGERRRTSYCSSRLACKRLFRRLTGDERTPATAIHTLDGDGVRPLAGGTGLRCSVSHDRRFTIAVAAETAVGVDVEALQDRLLENLPLYADDAEQTLVASSQLGAIAAAARVWTVKEAAAKVLGIDLAVAWGQVRVLEIGPEESRVALGAGPSVAARHAELDGHVITLLRRGDVPGEEAG